MSTPRAARRPALRTLGAILALLTGTAGADSKRYPAAPVDVDAVEEQVSHLWDAASDPQRGPYESMLASARADLESRSPDHAAAAEQQLDEAIALLPADPRAYRLRGEAGLLLQDWPTCADDFAAAWTRAQAVAPEPQRGASTDATEDRLELLRQLGLCQARAGRYALAERTLADAAASGAASGEMWMRLGEVRIAMGKLDEAVAALDAAREINDAPLVRWLLAGAYDRMRRPADALEQARIALASDRSLGVLRAPSLPLLGLGEGMYLLGLASAAQETPNGEAALAYFRKFLQLAPHSPWRKRAEDHIAELARVAFPEYVQKLSGNAPILPGVAESVIRKAMPGLRACLAKLPYTVIGVRTMKLGPRSAPAATLQHREDIFDLEAPFATPHGSPRAPPPRTPPGLYVQVEPVDTEIPPQAALADAIRCIEPQVAKLALPIPKELDSSYTLFFRIVGN